MVDKEDLKLRAKDLGLPLDSGVYKPKSEAWDQLDITASELHRRIREEERHRRENKLWIVAVIAAIASVVSAAAAWAPICIK